MMENIKIKGKSPLLDFSFNLNDIFFSFNGQRYSDVKSASWTSSSLEFSFDEFELFVNNNFKLQNRKTLRLPCSMYEDREKLLFNLHYQDTRIKLAIEENLNEGNSLINYDEDAKTLMTLISLLLHYPIKRCELWTLMNDNDLDALIYFVLNRYDINRERKLLINGINDNYYAFSGLPVKTELQNFDTNTIIFHHVFAGTVWWNQDKIKYINQFAHIKKMAIDDSNLFLKDVLYKKCNLVFICDDNGELVWDLILIQKLLDENPDLYINFIVNDLIVSNNANFITLNFCLLNDRLIKLKNNKRFKITLETNFRSSIDLIYSSSNLKKQLKQADIVLIKGVGGFETIQNLPIPSYYSFVVYSNNSQLCTGLPKGEGLFVKVDPNRYAYKFKRQTLFGNYTTNLRC